MSGIRLFFTGTIIVLLIGAGVAWVLSNQGIIPNVWAPSLGTTFSVLGVVVAFVQWTLPLPSSDTKASALSVKSGRIQEIFVKQIYDRLAEGTGSLIVYAKRENIGENIEAVHDSPNPKRLYETLGASIVERIVDGRPLAAAVFPNLKPDTYRVRGLGNSEDITVSPGGVSEVDWRRNSRQEKEKAKQQQRSQAGLRLRAVMIGLGGVLFLVHSYLQVPYLDIAGIILMGQGVVNLLSSLILDWLGWLQDDDAGAAGRTGIFMLELGGVLYLVHRYLMAPYLDIAGFIVGGLGVVVLIITIIITIVDGW
jgi:hypothetical protein